MRDEIRVSVNKLDIQDTYQIIFEYKDIVHNVCFFEGGDPVSSLKVALSSLLNNRIPVIENDQVVSYEPSFFERVCEKLTKKD